MKIISRFINKIKRGKSKKCKLPIRDLNVIKEKCKILFIDDEDFKFIERLKLNDGWKRISRINDLDSLTQPDLIDSYIVFVDVYGVGKQMGFSNEGLGLICAIKERYPNKKVIMYSGESGGNISVFDNAVNIADYRLSKTATQYEFDNLIQQYAEEAYNWENCIERIQKIIKSEIGIDYELNEVEKIVSNLIEKKQTDKKDVSAAFNIVDNAGSIADIISLFISLS